MNLTLNKAICNLFTSHSGLWWCPIKLNLAAKGSPVLKIQQKRYDPHTVTLTMQSIFHMTLAHNDAFPYYVWLQKVISFRRYHLGKKSITFWTFAVTLTLTTAKHTLHTTLDDCSSVTKVSAVQKVPSRQKIEFWTITMTLTFYTTMAHFQSMFWLMVVYQQTKFSKKIKINHHQFRRYSTDIVERVILWLYMPLLWPWPRR